MRTHSISSMAMAKEAVLRATDALRPGQLMGVLAFDTQPHWALPLTAITDNTSLSALRDPVSGIYADGGTDIYAALSAAADAIFPADADSKHVILLSDGRTEGADFAGLAREFRARGVRISAVAIGPGADRQLLNNLATWTDGRYAVADNPLQLPRIVTEELIRTRRSPVVEGTIKPLVRGRSPLLGAILSDELPPLNGYIATTPREAAEVVLAAEGGDPILAQWQYGLGRAVAWTSSLDPSWAQPWLAWPGAPRLWVQALQWLAPDPRNPNLHVRTRQDADTLLVQVDAYTPDGRFANLLDVSMTATRSDGGSRSTALSQTSPGRYEGKLGGLRPDVYRLDVRASRDGDIVEETITGAVVSAVRDLRKRGVHGALLQRLVDETGGLLVQEPAELMSRAQPVEQREQLPLRPWLTAAAMLVMLLDIAARQARWKWIRG